MGARSRYLATTASQRQLPGPTSALPATHLVRIASLAASSHNTQPWRFVVRDDEIVIRPDLTRRCPAVDPDDGHLWKSLGCAVESIALAAPTFGRRAEPRLDAANSAIRISLPPSDPPHEHELYRALARRGCTRGPFDGTPLRSDHLAALRVAGASREVDGVQTTWIDDAAARQVIRELVAAGNRAQLGDSAFRRELIDWIRFSPAAALRCGDGLAGLTGGRPSLPQPIGRLLARWLVRAESQVRTDDVFLASTPMIAAIVIQSDDVVHWVAAGRVVQRLMVQAAALDVRVAFVNQPIEVRSLRGPLRTILGIEKGTPTLLLRLGYGPMLPFSIRRPVEQVIDLR